MPIKMKVCNGAEYNRSLKQRGRIFHFFDTAVKNWLDRANTKFVYSNGLFEILAAVRYLLKAPFRQLQGLLEEYIELRKLKLPIPDFSTLCRRMKNLTLKIIDHRRNQRRASSIGKVDVVLDSSGINIYHTGGGHSKENGGDRKHKHYSQVRKMHIALNLETKDVVAMHMSSGSTADCAVAPIVIAMLPDPIDSIYADGAYDRISVRKACHARQAIQIIPPNRNARIRSPTNNDPPDLWAERNAAIAMMQSYITLEEGLKEWKKSQNYGVRSHVEGFFSRFKRCFGFHFTSRCDKSRENELITKINLLNFFNKDNVARYAKVT